MFSERSPSPLEKEDDDKELFLLMSNKTPCKNTTIVSDFCRLMKYLK